MSLRYALLAMLTSRPMTGYDVSKHFSTSVGHVWHAPDSQIYPELQRMERDGLIEGIVVPWGSRGKKKEYHITQAGIAEFRTWVNTPLGYSRERDRHHLKAAYLEWADPEAARQQMRDHIAFHTGQMQQWQDMRAALVDRTNPTLAKRLESAPASEHAKIAGFKIFTYEGLIERARTEIDWARRGLEVIDELHGVKAAEQA